MRGKHCNVEIAGKLRQITPCWKSIVAHIVRCVNKDRSPRVRGKQNKANYLAKFDGITPARAGKTKRRGRRVSCPWDHPRACGENNSCALTSPLAAGSPPRVRGKQHLFQRHHPVLGITPARAGKTTASTRDASFARDHPRACGENSSAGKLTGQDLGSPPRVRGKLRFALKRISLIRITPARAGKNMWKASPAQVL